MAGTCPATTSRNALPLRCPALYRDPPLAAVAKIKARMAGTSPVMTVETPLSFILFRGLFLQAVQGLHRLARRDVIGVDRGKGSDHRFFNRLLRILR